jgi:GT2 family glycosyltransferase/glycosyltransferase involved in cell wall biosynthesis
MGSERAPRAVTVVVTYNGLDDTIACLRSLLLSDYPEHRIVIVDNGSTGEADAIRASFGDQVAILAGEGNRGYGAGANAGIRWAVEHDADYVWVLNNDTVVRSETLRRLVESMEADPDIGIASPQITAPSGPEAPAGIWFSGGEIDLRRGETRHSVTPLSEDAGAVPTDFITGCAPMLRASMLDDVGLFWERLFLYWEDTDLVLRARRSGWATVVVAGAWIHHAIHGATESRTVDYLFFRNALIVARRHAGLRTATVATTHLAYRLGRRWASAFLRRRPAPVAESHGLLAGVATITRWTVRMPDDARLAPPARRMPGPRPLAVLHLVRRFAPLLGGTELYVRDLAEAQAREGYRVTVLTLDRDVTGVDRRHFPHLEHVNGVRIVRMPGIGSARFGITARPDTLLRELGRAGVVHIHDLRFMVGLTCLASRLRRKPVILHTHGLIFHTGWAAGLKRFLMRVYYGPLLRITGAIVAASSEPDHRRLMELAPYLNKGSIVVENAIRLEALLALPRTPQPGRVVSFGRIARSKSLDRLVEAIARVSHDSWELVIAGAEEAGERARLEGAITAAGVEGRVVFTGQYSDEGLCELLSTAAAAAFPSSGEGFGLALLQALAAGVPVIVSNIPAHLSLLGPELADRAVDFDDPAAAGLALRQVLAAEEETLRDLGERERRRALGFDVSRLASDVDSLYQVLGLGSRPNRT